MTIDYKKLHKEFQDNLKPGDIIYKNDRQYKFVKFKYCRQMMPDFSILSSRCIHCRGDYILKEIKYEVEMISIGCIFYDKFEEFITESEFSV